MATYLPGPTDRYVEPELMDDPLLARERHERALVGLSRINFWSRTAQVFCRRLRLWSGPSKTMRVLDLACGGGDVVLRLEMLARRQGVAIQVDGCDISSRAIGYARRRAQVLSSAATFFQLDVLRDPLPEYDVFISSLFLHHLRRRDVVRLLHQASRFSRRGLLISDLERTRTGYLLALLACRVLTRSSVVHTDSLRSVRAAFSLSELGQMARDAGLSGFRLSRVWPCRVLLSWRTQQT